jgi:cyclic beta-1,2-glucan synthetase
VRLSHGQLSVQPCLPPHWSQARVRLHTGGRGVEVLVQRAAANAKAPAGYRPLTPGTVLVLSEVPGDLRLWVPATERALAPRAEPALV